MPGTASTVQSTKKLVQPTRSTMTPVTAFASVRGVAASAVNSANWVAANALLVERAMNAVNAAVPSPTPRYSKTTTAPSSQDADDLHDAEQPQRPVDRQLHHDQSADHCTADSGAQRCRFRDRTDLSQRESDVDKERRLQRRRHVVAELVEEQEGEDQQRRRDAPPGDEFAERLDHCRAQGLRRLRVAHRLRYRQRHDYAHAHESRHDQEHAVPWQVVREDQRQRARDQP
jgi:hypothetical protein